MRIPHAAAVRPNKFATAGSDTERLLAISGRKGDRVLPVEVAANMPMRAASTIRHGMALTDDIGRPGQIITHLSMDTGVENFRQVEKPIRNLSSELPDHSPFDAPVYILLQPLQYLQN